MVSHLNGRRLAVVIAAVAGALAIAGAAGASQHATTAALDSSVFGPNVKIFDPSMSTSEIRATSTRSPRSRSRTSSGRSATRCSSCPARYGSPPIRSTSRSATTPRSRASAARRTTSPSTARSTSYNQCFGAERLHRARQLLALRVEPDDQRRGQGGLPVRRVLGDVAGRADAARARQRLRDAHGLLHRPVLRERRLHRRLAVLRRHRSSTARSSSTWSGTAASTAGRTASGTRSSPASQGAPPQSFPDPPYTTLDTNPASREKPFLYVDANRPLQRLRPRRAVQLVGHDVGRRPDARPLAPDRELLHREARRTASSRSTTRCRAARTCIFTPGVYDVDKTIKVKRADTIVLGLGMATLTAQNGVVPMTVADVKGVEISGLIFDAGPVTSPALLQFGDLHGRRARPHHGIDRRERPGRAPRRVLPHRRPARRQGHRASWSTATTRSSTTSGRGAPTTATASAGRATPPTPASSSPATTSSRPASSSSTTRSTTSSGHGENGKTIMFQNEMPYDPPNQAAWQHDGVARLGRLQGRRLGAGPTRAGASGATASSTSIPTIHATRAFEVPVTPRREAARHPHAVDLEQRDDRPRRQRRRRRRRPRTRSPVNVVSYP